MSDPPPGIPTIAPLEPGVVRPFWSVVVPARNPRPEFLQAALDSVLNQDPGADAMQIEVLDDFSDKLDVGRFVGERYGDRVEVYRGDGHRGMAGNWNAGIERACGHWIHILHDDDMVRPGFYAILGAAVEKRPEVGAAFTFHHMIDGTGRLLRGCHMPPRPAGIIDDWMEDVFVSLKIQTPSIVVRRGVYEAIGGFDQSYRFFTDWDMWQRIAAAYPIWYDPTPLAYYREHGAGTTIISMFSREGVREMVRILDRMRRLLPAAQADAVMDRARQHYASLWVRNAWRVVARGGDLPRALSLLHELQRAFSTRLLLKGLSQRVRQRLAS
jgi:GT2 family glycosyltransferase